MKNSALVVVLNGTGIYSMTSDEELPPHISYLLSNKKISVLTIDRPGIAYVASSVVVDEKLYNQHTQKILVECVVKALEWASKQDGINLDKKIYFVGHSEGAQISAMVYYSLLSTNSTLAKYVAMLVMSGTPMKPWKNIIEYQFDNIQMKKFWAALKDNDNNALKNFGGVPAIYWRDILSTESLEDVLKKLAKYSPSASLQFFHGLEDKNVSVKAVQNFEKWNTTQFVKKNSSLKMSSRYYLSNHNLNMTAINDLIMLLLGYIQE